MTGFNQFESEVANNLFDAFLFDLVYENPMIKDSSKEYCDVLVNFFDELLVIQCKETNLENDDLQKIINKNVVAGLRQLRTSVNRAKTKNVSIKLKNDIQGELEYDFENLKEIYPMIVVNKTVPFLSYEYLKKQYPEFNKLNFLPIILTLEDLIFLIDYLDTPKDLFEYFKKREKVIKDGKIMFETEKDLISFYLLSHRTFEKEDIPENASVIMSNVDSIYTKGEIGKMTEKVQEANNISYWIDGILKRMFTSKHPHYLEVAEIMSNYCRAERRHIAKCALEKCNKAYRNNGEAYRFVKLEDKMPIVFYFAKVDSLDEWQNRLTALIVTAKYITKSQKILGISHAPMPEGYTVIDDKILIALDFHPETFDDKEIIEAIPTLWGDVFKDESFGHFPQEVIDWYKNEYKDDL